MFCSALSLCLLKRPSRAAEQNRPTFIEISICLRQNHFLKIHFQVSDSEGGQSCSAAASPCRGASGSARCMEQRKEEEDEDEEEEEEEEEDAEVLRSRVYVQK